MKKKPGTAPPPDLGKSVRLNGGSNRVEMIYVNSQQPVAPKVRESVIPCERSGVCSYILKEILLSRHAG